MRVGVNDDHPRWDSTSPTLMVLDRALLRDYFAAQAIGCFQLRDEDLDALMNKTVRPMHEIVAEFAYGLADAMMAERSK